MLRAIWNGKSASFSACMLEISRIQPTFSAAEARAMNCISSARFWPIASNSISPLFWPIHFFHALAMELCLSAYAMRNAADSVLAALITSSEASRISMRAGFNSSITRATASLVKYCSVRPGKPNTMVKSPSLVPPTLTGK